MINIKDLTVNDITPDLLMKFNHRQKITQKWVFCNNEWKAAEASDLREWSKEKRVWISTYLCDQIKQGGFAAAAFAEDKLIGFCSICGEKMCDNFTYTNLTMLFVDDEWQKKGVGRKLFDRACTKAKERNMDRIFISAIPSVETIAFYTGVGCIDAHKIISDFVDTEKDRYLEYILSK